MPESTMPVKRTEMGIEARQGDFEGMTRKEKDKGKKHVKTHIQRQMSKKRTHL